MTPWVKVCGVTDPDDVALVAREGADALGLVVEYPEPVPWTLDRRRAAELAALVPPGVATVAVVGGDASAILALAEAVAPDALQLHHEESPVTVAAVARAVAGTGTLVIKALHLEAGDREAVSADWPATIARFAEAGADLVLLDARTAPRPAGTGAPVPWAALRAVLAGAPVPVVLAGGLTPENVGRAVRGARPWGVDVLSAVEDERRRKVPERVRGFVAAARAAGTGRGAPAARADPPGAP